MDLETLNFEIRDRVATITLNRPDKGNAMNLRMAQELLTVSLECDQDSDIGAVVIRGTGKFFTAGGDLGSFVDAGDALPLRLKELTTYLHAALSRFARMDPPVIGCVNGMAAGAGMSLSCACDLVIAAESARFTMAYTKAGLTPDNSATWFLPRVVGLRRAQELILTNRTLSSSEARDWGIVTRVVADADLDRQVADLAQAIASGPTSAFGRSKRLLLASASDSLETQMEREAQEIACAAAGPDAREGLAAFVDKRKPQFGKRPQ